MHLNFFTLAGGIYGLLAALGVIRVSNNPEANEAWLRKFGSMLKMLSPAVILFGLAELFGVPTWRLSLTHIRAIQSPKSLLA